MHLEIRHLKLVAAIAETGSVTRASNRLHLTQSALSHQLRDAEEQLGARLFERQKGTMTPTAAGEGCCSRHGPFWRNWSARKRRFRRQRMQQRRGSRVDPALDGVLHGVSLAAAALENVSAQLSGGGVRTGRGGHGQSVRGAAGGKLDLAIVCAPIRNRKIRYTPLFEDEMVVLVSPEHRMAGKMYAEPQDFADEKGCHLSAEATVRC